MADVPISGLTALGGAPAAGDLVAVVDISDTTQAPTGTTKKMTTANLFTSPTISAPVVTSGLTVSSGTTTVQDLTATQLSASTSGEALALTGSTTSARWAQINTDGGSAIFGMEQSTGGNLITGDSGYDTVIRGASALAFSANGGSTLHARMTSAGAMNFVGNVSIATNKFTVTAASGNTVVAGTLAVTGAITATGGVAGALAVTGDVTIGASTLIITASSGSILSAGSVQAGGRGTFQNSLIFAVGGAGGGVPFSWLSTIATATVTSSAVALSSLTFGKGGLVMVYGTDGTNKFLDLVLYGATTTTVISSTTVAGAPVARTYTMAASTLKLAMASGSYSVDTTEIAKGN